MPSKQQRAKFGEAVKQLREAREWTQEELAERLGLAPGTIGNWELGGGAREANVIATEELFGLEPGQLGSILGQASAPTRVAPEDAIRADPALTEREKRAFLAALAEVRKITEEETNA